MTTDYDRISADDLSSQTEDRLEHNEGEQTTHTLKTSDKGAEGADRKSAARKKSADRSGARKAAACKTTAKKTPVRKRSVSPATKAQVRAQASQAAEAQSLLCQQIDAIFDDGAAQSAKARAARTRAAKAEAKGLVWTLSALALAACGGGGGGSPAPVTGGSVGATGPQTSTGGGNVRFVDGVRLTTTILSQTERDGMTVNVGSAADDAARSGDIAVVVEGSWLILSNEMFGISDADANDTSADITFHMANAANNHHGGESDADLKEVDGAFQVWDGSAWAASDTFTLQQLKAGKVRFQHDGSERESIDIRYSVYDGLVGGDGDDVLDGGAGDDVLNGVDGNNWLTGGAGADRFVLNRNGTGTTTVTDFEDGRDKIRVYTSDKEAKASLHDLKLDVSVHNTSDTKITHSVSNDIYMILNDIRFSEISFSDFEIV